MTRAIAHVLAASCAAISGSAYAQDPAEYDRSLEPIRDIVQLVPEGWRMAATAIGDLNGDTREDVAMVVQETDPDKVIGNDGLGYDKYNTNPRILLVALRQSDGSFEQVAQSGEIIPLWASATMDDPFDHIAIENGKLQLLVRFWANAGSWSMFGRTFTSRWQADTMALIGYDYIHVHRGSGDLTEISVNYLTRQMTRAEGSIEDDDLVSVPSRFAMPELLTLDTVGDGFDFEPPASPEN